MAVFCRSTLHYSSVNAQAGPAPTGVDVLDGRVAELPAWPVCGFELLPHTSAVRDWRDDDEIASVHYAELEDLARELTGCDVAVVSGHITRSPEAASRHNDLGPITFVHSDFAASYDENIRRSFRTADEDRREALSTRTGLTVDLVEGARRIVVLQFWRNVGPAKMDFPLAFCDARTIGPDEVRAFVVSDYAGAGGPDFEALAVIAPGEPTPHRWYAFPEMGADEVVAFRTYDTELVREGRTFFTPHSAVRDPDVAVGEPSRVSVELRAICLFA